MLRIRQIANGWGLWTTATTTVACCCAYLLVRHGSGEDGVRAVLRLTARTSLVFFCSAFVGSSLQRLHRGTATRWLLRNRRYLGLAFAASHAIHGVAIIELLRVTATGLELTPALVGGAAYLFIIAMTVTSFDRTAAWLGRRRWHQLHLVGSYYIFLVFLMTYAPQLPGNPIALGGVLLLIAVLCVRIGARRRVTEPAPSA